MQIARMPSKQRLIRIAKERLRRKAARVSPAESADVAKNRLTQEITMPRQKEKPDLPQLAKSDP
jgi:hypothetical protein